MKLNIALLVLCALCLEETRSARILAMIATPSYSHQIPYRKLWTSLHERGHEVVLATTNPIPNINSTRFRQIDISESYGSFRATSFLKLRFEGVSWLRFAQENLFPLVDVFTEHLLNNTEMRRLYAPDSDAKFDVVLTEFLYMPATYAIAYRFKAPLIGLSSLGLVSLNEFALGGFVLPSHEYTWEMEANTGTNLSFWQRLRNFVNLWKITYLLYHDLFPRQQKMAEHYLGMELPPLIDIMKNVSLLFVNQAEALTPARPLLPNMITFTSFHIEKNPPPVPKDLKRFMDESKEGFIYMSLGSNARSADIPMHVKQIFFDVFSKLPYRIVWKYEEDFPVKLDNVFTAKWLPQQSILAHPNIKLFIYQGGLQSTEETVSFTVPVLGFPVLADQDYQTSRMDVLGVGKRLEITTVTREELDHAIKEIITNKEYKERMIKLRELIRDVPYDAVDNLVWWTEYVIRHKGAPHLRSTLTSQPWYQRYDLDVVVFLSIVAFVIVSTLVNIIARIIVRIHKQLLSSTTQKKKIS
nr:PREDICTED: UDP-glucuronosyltransferase 1-2-like [Megachile rotundata]